LARIAASSPRKAAQSTPQSAEGFRGHAVIRLDEAPREMLGIEHGALERFGELLAATMASWPFR